MKGALERFQEFGPDADSLHGQGFRKNLVGTKKAEEFSSPIREARGRFGIDAGVATVSKGDERPFVALLAEDIDSIVADFPMLQAQIARD